MICSASMLLLSASGECRDQATPGLFERLDSKQACLKHFRQQIVLPEDYEGVQITIHEFFIGAHESRSTHPPCRSEHSVAFLASRRPQSSTSMNSLCGRYPNAADLQKLRSSLYTHLSTSPWFPDVLNGEAYAGYWLA